MVETILVVMSAVSGVNVAALLAVAYQAGKQVQRLDHVEKKLDRLLQQCPACQVGATR